jgi:hypothetical protein
MKHFSPTTLWRMGLSTILIGAGMLGWLAWGTGIDSTGSLLAVVILLSSFCAVLGQKDAFRISDDIMPAILLAGLGLGSVIGVEPVNRMFMIGLLGYAGVFLFRYRGTSPQKTLALAHLGLALLFSVMAVVMGEKAPMTGGLFLLITFLPLIPFHLPLLGIVRASQMSLAGIWVVVWLATGLSQLKNLEGTLPFEGMGIFPVLALGSALYASLKAMGHRLPRESLAYATIVLLALPWGLVDEFSQVAAWGIPFGIAVALLTSAMWLAFAFLHERYGAHSLATLHGLGSGMPRFRGVFTLLISLVMLLPVLPVIGGLTTIPPDTPETDGLFPVWLLLLTVWLSVNWIFTTMLHQSAFGKPRPDISHRDLSAYETGTLLLLMGTASLCGTLV